jgi:hypothetical protein
MFGCAVSWSTLGGGDPPMRGTATRWRSGPSPCRLPRHPQPPGEAGEGGVGEAAAVPAFAAGGGRNRHHIEDLMILATLVYDGGWAIVEPRWN